MAKLVEEGVQMQCQHTGTVQVSASISRVTIGGSAPLAQDDTFTVAGCPFTTGGAPQPCVELEWLTATERVTAEGKALLLDSSSGLCKAGGDIPQGSPQIMATQHRVEAK